MTNRDIIVIGGSMGASNPLKRILAELPGGLPAALFIVTHMPARSRGILATMRRSRSVLPIMPASDGASITRGSVYVAVPDHHLLLEGDRMKLARGPRENLARPAIDPLFRSAALAFGPRVIGVILSGLLNDGAAGLQAIKQCGGVAVVQDPADAAADEMPCGALEAGPADHCLAAGRIAGLLAVLSREPPGPAHPVPPGLRLEVEIAADGRANAERLQRLADPAPVTCPACHGVLSEVRGSKPLRFRCQVGHAYTGAALLENHERALDEALGIALRVIEERAALVSRMARDAHESRRTALAALYDERTREYRRHAETIRRAVLAPPKQDDVGAAERDAAGSGSIG